MDRAQRGAYRPVVVLPRNERNRRFFREGTSRAASSAFMIATSRCYVFIVPPPAIDRHVLPFRRKPWLQENGAVFPVSQPGPGSEPCRYIVAVDAIKGERFVPDAKFAEEWCKGEEDRVDEVSEIAAGKWQDMRPGSCAAKSSLNRRESSGWRGRP